MCRIAVWKHCHDANYAGAPAWTHLTLLYSLFKVADVLDICNYNSVRVLSPNQYYLTIWHLIGEQLCRLFSSSKTSDPVHLRKRTFCFHDFISASLAFGVSHATAVNVSTHFGYTPYSSFHKHRYHIKVENIISYYHTYNYAGQHFYPTTVCHNIENCCLSVCIYCFYI